MTAKLTTKCITYVDQMEADNPFRSFGFRWEWHCSTCRARGGTMTKADAIKEAKRHRKGMNV